MTVNSNLIETNQADWGHFDRLVIHLLGSELNSRGSCSGSKPDLPIRCVICLVPTGKCLDRSDLLHKVFISDCDTSKTTQKWEMNNIVAV